MKTAIETKNGMKRAIRKAKEVYVRVRFGVVEHDVKITKAEAKMLIDQVEDGATPEDVEMYGSCFGFYDAEQSTVWMG